MSEKTQNGFIILSVILGAAALLWTILRNSPVGGPLKYAESGAWLPSTNIPAVLRSGDIIIEPNNFAPWDTMTPGALSSPATGPIGKGSSCDCGPSFCKSELNAGFETFTSGVLNAAIFSAPWDTNYYLGY